MDFGAGTVIFAPNMEGWKDVPLKKELEKQLGVPVFVENDCNIAVLGSMSPNSNPNPAAWSESLSAPGLGPA